MIPMFILFDFLVSRVSTKRFPYGRTNVIPKVFPSFSEMLRRTFGGVDNTIGRQRIHKFYQIMKSSSRNGTPIVK